MDCLFLCGYNIQYLAVFESMNLNFEWKYIFNKENKWERLEKNWKNFTCCTCFSFNPKNIIRFVIYKLLYVVNFISILLWGGGNDSDSQYLAVISWHFIKQFSWKWLSTPFFHLPPRGVLALHLYIFVIVISPLKIVVSLCYTCRLSAK